MPERWCERCEVRPVHKAGRCTTCYDYRRRTGRDRPLTLIYRALVRSEEDRLAALAWPRGEPGRRL